MRKKSNVPNKKDNKKKLLRAELLFTPILLITPLLVSLFLIHDWFYRGFLNGISTYNGELFIGITILIGNILFDIPFIKSLINLSRR